MSESDDARRMQEVLAQLVARRIGESLGAVEAALAAWRRGDKDVLDAHAEALRHAARASALSSRVARAGLEGPATLLRDAHDLGLVDEVEFQRLTGKRVADVAPPAALDDDGVVAEAQHAMPDKQSVVEALLKDGPVLIHLDSRRADVDVPHAHRGDPKLALRLGYGLSPPIHDLAFDAHGVIATLTFRGVPHRCVVAWPAIYAVVAEDGRGLVWPESVPPEVAKDFGPRGEGGKPGGDGDGDGDGDGGDKPPGPEKPKRGHLKLV